jgi:hypothetical protein
MDPKTVVRPLAGVVYVERQGTGSFVESFGQDILIQEGEPAW